MGVPIQELPDNVLRELIATIVNAAPAQRLTLISSLDARVRTSTLAILMDSVLLPDDARLLDSSKTHLLPNAGCVSALLANASRYGPYVHNLKVSDPLMFASVDEPPPTLLQFEDGAASDIEDVNATSHNSSGINPLPANTLFEIMSFCPNLEHFEWCSSTPPPDGLCEILATHNTKLTSCMFIPPPNLLHGDATARQALPRWNAPSLPQLSTLPLTTLHVHRLSQSGARSLSNLLRKMSEYSALEDVWLDFLWLDDTLCESLVGAGRRLKNLRLGTSGTKLTDRGMTAILEGCDNLEDLSLVDVQGRLSRNLWSKVPDLPVSMKALRIATSETGPHHSWTVDHLLSLPSLPLDTIEILSVNRIIHPFSTQVDDLATLQPVPTELLERLKSEECAGITELQLDWWGWSPTDLKELLAHNTQLESLQITFDAPIAKMFSLSNVFANMTQLRTLKVRIPERHAHGSPVQQYHINQHQLSESGSPTADRPSLGLMTPASSPVNSTRGIGTRRCSVSPSVKPSSLPIPPRTSTFQTPPATPSDAFSTLSLSFTAVSPVNSTLPSELTQASSVSSRNGADPSLPNQREIQKFARRCPKLETLDWYGKNGRGSWSISREGSSSSGPSAVLSASTTSSLSGTGGSGGSGANNAAGTTVTVKVEHSPPCFPSLDILQAAALAQEAEEWGWEPSVPRLGHEWQGPAADAWRTEQEREREEAEVAATTAAAQAAEASAAAAAAQAAALAASAAIPPPTKKYKSATAASGLPKLQTGGSTTANGGGSSRRRSSVPLSASPTKAMNAQGSKRTQDGSNTTGGRSRGGRSVGASPTDTLAISGGPPTAGLAPPNTRRRGGSIANSAKSDGFSTVGGGGGARGAVPRGSVSSRTSMPPPASGSATGNGTPQGALSRSKPQSGSTARTGTGGANAPRRNAKSTV